MITLLSYRLRFLLRLASGVFSQYLYNPEETRMAIRVPSPGLYDA
jgi:hypothetical protein